VGGAPSGNGGVPNRESPRVRPPASLAALAPLLPCRGQREWVTNPASSINLTPFPSSTATFSSSFSLTSLTRLAQLALAITSSRPYFNPRSGAIARVAPQICPLRLNLPSDSALPLVSLPLLYL